MDDKQKCMMCDSLLARTFFDFRGKRIYLCQQDANALLRVLSKESPDTFDNNYRLMESLVYGKETSELDPTPLQVHELLTGTP